MDCGFSVGSLGMWKRTRKKVKWAFFGGRLHRDPSHAKTIDREEVRGQTEFAEWSQMNAERTSRKDGAAAAVVIQNATMRHRHRDGLEEEVAW